MWIRPVSAVAGQLEKTHIQESIPTQALNTVPKQARGTIITKALGDLNRDGHVEQVVVVNIDGNREIHIYQYRHHQWQLWQSSAFHIMDSGDGGRDWFQDINIVRGALVIRHRGALVIGSFSQIERFRFNGKDCPMIGVTQ